MSSATPRISQTSFNHQGLVWSTSIFNRTQGIESITPYYLKAQSDPKEAVKEAVWEQVRKDHFPLLPSRQGAFFLFESESVARKRSAEWFPGQDRWFLRSQIVEGSGVMVADARWLNCQQQDWEKNAREYWAGNETSDPQREILVDGGVYFPDRRAEPFGFFRPQA